MLKTNRKFAPILFSFLTLTGGCVTQGEQDAFVEQMIYQGAAAKAREKGDYARADAWERVGTVMGNISAQKAGRSEINVNVREGDSNSRRRDEKYRADIRESFQEFYEDLGKIGRNSSNESEIDYVFREARRIEGLLLREDFSDELTESIERVYERSNKIPGRGGFNGGPEFFAANYWMDLNQNNFPELNEIVGYMDEDRRDFNQTERISFWMQNFGKSHGTLELKIHGPDKKRVYYTKIPSAEGKSRILPNLEGFPPGHFKDKGTHLASYFMDGELKGSIQFSIH